MSAVIIKIFAEAITTLYAVVVRTSSFSPLTQSAFRSLIIPLVFIPFVVFLPQFSTSIFSISWIYVGVINLIHIISSFQAFKILPTGPALTIYFTYPLIAVVLAYLLLGRTISLYSVIGIFTAIVGVILLNRKDDNTQLMENISLMEINTTGISWALISALTEALLYIYVISGGKTFDNYNFLVVSIYFWAGIVGLIYLLTQVPFTSSDKTKESVGVNGSEQVSPPLLSWDSGFLVLANLLLGVGGIYLLHMTERLLPTGIYASLSYIGVFFAYIYGLFMGDGLRLNDIIASILVVGGSIFGGIM